MSSQQPGILVKEFGQKQGKEYTSGWINLWEKQEDKLWDRGKPSPALVDLIEQSPHLIGPPIENGRRRKVLVPGCGRGYDVVMLALHGYDAFGVDFAPEAIEAAKKYAQSELAGPQAYNFGEGGWQLPAEVGQGSVGYQVGDFFSDEWNDNVGKVDAIYDYTFLCALHPTMRIQWAAKMDRLLSPGGRVTCLEFPLYKDPKLEGPPWGLNGAHWDLLQLGGDGILTEDKKVVGQDNGGKFNRIYREIPKRTYPQGEGTDYLSVYVKK